MHKLDRSAVVAPPCLAVFDYQYQDWHDLGPSCKNQVREALVCLQGNPASLDDHMRCAYCEGVIFDGGHTEHFRRKHKAHYPELTFEWSNLFRSCDARMHCGHHKDRKGATNYDPGKLIKPDEVDPEHFLYFHSSGEVRPKEGLFDDDKDVAKETIQVFGLNEGSLQGKRRKAVATIKQRYFKDLQELASWSEEDRQCYVQAELEATRWHPYATTIKHFLMAA